MPPPHLNASGGDFNFGQRETGFEFELNQLRVMCFSNDLLQVPQGSGHVTPGCPNGCAGNRHGKPNAAIAAFHRKFLRTLDRLSGFGILFLTET